MRAAAIPLALLVALTAFAQQPTEDEWGEDDPFQETIYVVRYALDVRVTDRAGRAIEDLQPGDFTVTIGKQPAVVEDAIWVAQGKRTVVPEPSFEDEVALGEEPVQRSIVVLIQTDFARVSGRVVGQMRFNHLAEDIMEMLGPNDRVAVFSHDSRLKFRSDLTADRDATLKAIRASLFIDSPPPPAPSTDGPSLAPHVDATEMKRAAHAEAGLLLIAKALRTIDDPKMILVAGWGIGEMQGRAGVQLKDEWVDAVSLLRRQNVPVVTIGTGLEGTLTAGLAATANATGGFYAGTQAFASQALQRLEGTLSGHYALTLRVDDPLEPGEYPLRVRVHRKDLQVQAPPFVIHGR